ncbi:MAG TPA: CocE/NonD family hydrolase, partial [Longimicrobiaceae bacterium]|nr:CocE/NonD family hydrolase [Longimicrobiaceae bacterium]
MPAADGVHLCTDVYLPEPDAPMPAVVVRTPYGRTTPFLLHLALRLNRAGLAVVLQDCRGRNQSAGEADWRGEESDGFDTLAWIGRQPWCSGRVGLVGVSISSLPLFSLAAGRAPDAVRIGALVNIMGVVDVRSAAYRDGALVLHWVLPWLHLMGSRQTTRGGWQAQPWDEVFSTLPLADTRAGEPFDCDLWRQLLSHPDPGET